MPPPPPPALPRTAPWELREVTLTNARPRVGTRSETRTVVYAFRPEGRRAKPFGVVLWWPRARPVGDDPHRVPFLRVQATHGPGRAAFGGREQLDAVFASFNRQAELFGPATRDRNDFAIARLEGRCEVHLRFVVDTESPDFLELAYDHLDRRGGPFALAVQLHLFDDDRRGDQKAVIAVKLDGADTPELDPGLVGIDLGHTASTVAWLSPLGGTSSAAVQVLDAQGRPRDDGFEPLYPLGRLDKAAPPVVSDLELTRMGAAATEEDRELLDWAVWSIGSRPGAPLGESLLGSVKRLLTDPGRSPTRRLLAYPTVAPRDRETLTEQQVSSRLPAELFVCRLFQRFREAAGRSVSRFAVTYPTTFSRRELELVREAVSRAWLRMMERPQAELADLSGRLALDLDEASAAGFYFLQRKLFEQPHGLARFRYLYPGGFNLLLYDCGGGTTDIGLLRAEVLDKPTRVQIRVIGRSGERSFGGDTVTEAIFRLLKARLAVALAASLPGLADEVPRAVPEDAGQLAAFLDEHDGAFNRAVPTRFDAEVLRDAKAARGRALTLELWAMAEQIKHAFGQPRDGALPAAIPVILRRGGALAKNIAGEIGEAERSAFEARLRGADVTRAQVDALILKPLRSSIERCNYLLREKLMKKRGDEAHWVVLAGNGGRYPLFAEEMACWLAVPFLDERLERFSAEGQADLKYAVAKGAVLALASEVFLSNVKVHFDRELCDRMPFDLGYKDRNLNEYVPLLREDERYDKLSGGSDELPVELAAGLENMVLLYRRWPGDEDWWPYLLFALPDRPRDKVRVKYDAARRGFVVFVGEEPARLVQELIEDLSETELAKVIGAPDPKAVLRRFHYSPVQRGTL